jgi:Ribbon-helix-helix protein, copG family
MRDRPVAIALPGLLNLPEGNRVRYHRHRWYHIRMEKTTLYLPDDLKAAVKRAAAQEQISEAEVIRQSIRQVVCAVRPRPRGGLFSSGHPIARHTDELLSGFGER